MQTNWPTQSKLHLTDKLIIIVLKLLELSRLALKPNQFPAGCWAYEKKPVPGGHVSPCLQFSALASMLVIRICWRCTVELDAIEYILVWDYTIQLASFCCTICTELNPPTDHLFLDGTILDRLSSRYCYCCCRFPSHPMPLQRLDSSEFAVEPEKIWDHDTPCYDQKERKNPKRSLIYTILLPVLSRTSFTGRYLSWAG